MGATGQLCSSENIVLQGGGWNTASKKAERVAEIDACFLKVQSSLETSGVTNGTNGLNVF